MKFYDPEFMKVKINAGDSRLFIFETSHLFEPQYEINVNSVIYGGTILDEDIIDKKYYVVVTGDTRGLIAKLSITFSIKESAYTLTKNVFIEFV